MGSSRRVVGGQAPKPSVVRGFLGLVDLAQRSSAAELAGRFEDPLAQAVNLAPRQPRPNWIGDTDRVLRLRPGARLVFDGGEEPLDLVDAPESIS